MMVLYKEEMDIDGIDPGSFFVNFYNFGNVNFADVLFANAQNHKLGIAPKLSGEYPKWFPYTYL